MMSVMVMGVFMVRTSLFDGFLVRLLQLASAGGVSCEVDPVVGFSMTCGDSGDFEEGHHRRYIVGLEFDPLSFGGEVILPEMGDCLEAVLRRSILTLAVGADTLFRRVEDFGSFHSCLPPCAMPSGFLSRYWHSAS